MNIGYYVEFISDNKLLELKNNLSDVCNSIIREQKYTIYDYLGENGIIKYPINCIIKDVSLKNAEVQENGKIKDVHVLDNAITLYDAYKNLPDNILSDERMWVPLTLGKFLPYMLSRGDYTEKAVEQDFFFSSTHGPRAIFRNKISGLFWNAKMSFDPDAKWGDTLEFLRYAYEYEHTDIFVSIFEQPVYKNSEVRFGALDALYELEKKENININREDIRFVGRYANRLAGSSILEIYTRDEIKEIMKRGILRFKKKHL